MNHNASSGMYPSIYNKVAMYLLAKQTCIQQYIAEITSMPFGLLISALPSEKEKLL